MDLLIQFGAYLSQLDWMYIFTLIIIVYGASHKSIKNTASKQLKWLPSKRYLAFIIGALYGLLLYVLRGYTKGDIETLLQSYTFAVVFHSLIIDKFFKRLTISQNFK